MHQGYIQPKGIGKQEGTIMATTTVNLGNTATTYTNIALANISVIAAGGADIITLGNGNDTVKLGNGNDIITVGNGNDIITVGNGNDVITAGNGNDIITAGNGNDTITVGSGNDLITAGNGTDTVNINGSTTTTSNDVVILGNGNDTVNVTGDVNLTLLLGNGANHINLAGSYGTDIVRAGNGNNAINIGNGDNSTIHFGNGNNVILVGGGNNNTVFLGDGNNVIDAGAGSDKIYAGEGNNLFIYEGEKNALNTNAHGRSFYKADVEEHSTKIDSLILKMSYGQYTTEFVPFDQAHLATYLADPNHNETQFSFNSFPLTIEGFSKVTVMEVDLGGPTAPVLSNNLIADFSQGTAVIGNLSATDPDVLDSLTWTVTGAYANDFIIANMANSTNATGPTTSTAVLEIAPGVTLTDNVPNGMFPITVTATDLAGQSISQNFTVQLTPVATAPTLSVATPVTEIQGTPITLTINSALATLSDASDSLSVKISGFTVGESLSAGTHNADGSYTLTSAQLTGLTFNSTVAGTANLTVTATETSTINGLSASASVSDPLLINVIPASAPAPVISTAAAIGEETTNIPLSLSVGLAAGETLTSLVISSIPVGFTLTDGTLADTFHETSVGQSVDIASWNLANLTINPGTNVGSYTLNIAATGQEGTITSLTSTESILLTSLNGPTIAGPSIINTPDFTVAGTVFVPFNVTDPNPDSFPMSWAIVSGGGGNFLITNTGALEATQNLTVHINNPNSTAANLVSTFPLTIEAIDAHGVASDIFNVTVQLTPVATAPSVTMTTATSSVIEGATVSYILSSSIQGQTDVSDNFYLTVSGLQAGQTLDTGTLNPDGTYTLPFSTNSFNLLTGNFVGTETISVTATETSTVNGLTASASSIAAQEGLIVLPAAPQLNISPAPATEGQSSQLNLSVNFADNAETLNSLVLSGIPVGVTLTDGINSFTATAGNQTAMTSNQSEDITNWNLANLSVNPGEFEGTATMQVSAQGAENGLLSAVTQNTFILNVAGVAEAPTFLSVGNFSNINENVSATNNISLGLAIAPPIEATGDHDTVSVAISGLPIGAHIVLGDGTPVDANNLTMAQANQAVLILPPEFEGNVNLTVTATTTEDVGGSTASNTIPINFTVNGIADAPALSVAHIADVIESDSSNNLNIINLGAVVTPPTEAANDHDTVSVSITGLPTGAFLADANGVAFADPATNLTVAEANAAHLVLPAEFEGNVNLTVNATTTEDVGGSQATSTQAIQFAVQGVPDAPAAAPQITTFPLSNNILITAPVAPEAGDSLVFVITVSPSGAGLLPAYNNTGVVLLSSVPNSTMPPNGTISTLSNHSGMLSTIIVTLNPGQTQANLGIFNTSPTTSSYIYTLNAISQIQEENGALSKASGVSNLFSITQPISSPITDLTPINIVNDFSIANPVSLALFAIPSNFTSSAFTVDNPFNLDGLTINTTNGLLSGSAAAFGDYNFTVTGLGTNPFGTQFANNPVHLHVNTLDDSGISGAVGSFSVDANQVIDANGAHLLNGITDLVIKGTINDANNFSISAMDGHRTFIGGTGSNNNLNYSADTTHGVIISYDPHSQFGSVSDGNGHIDTISNFQNITGTAQSDIFNISSVGGMHYDGNHGSSSDFDTLSYQSDQTDIGLAIVYNQQTQSGTVYSPNTTDTISNFNEIIAGNATVGANFSFEGTPNGDTFVNGGGANQNGAFYNNLTLPVNDILHIDLTSGQAYLTDSANNLIGLPDTLVGFNNIYGANGATIVNFNSVSDFFSSGSDPTHNVVDFSGISSNINLVNTINLSNIDNVQNINLGANTDLTVSLADVLNTNTPNNEVIINSSATNAATDKVTLTSLSNSGGTWTQQATPETHTDINGVTHTYNVMSYSDGVTHATALVDEAIHNLHTAVVVVAAK